MSIVTPPEMMSATEHDNPNTAVAMSPFVGDHVANETPIRLHLAMTGAEGCAVRALGLIVRRGWYLHATELLPGQPGEKRAMTVSVLRRDATRNLPTLLSQLERLFDLETVTVLDDTHDTTSSDLPAAHTEEGAQT